MSWIRNTGSGAGVLFTSVGDPHRNDADPDPTFHFDADPEPDPDHTLTFKHVVKS
jgi:hypothetical protein